MNSTTLKTFLASFAIASGLASLLQADSTFSGTGLWTDSTKWSNGIPGTGDRAYIGEGASASIDGQTDDHSVNVGYIEPRNGATLTINNSTVTISEAFNLASQVNRTNTVVVTDSAISQKTAYVGKAGCNVAYTQRGGSFISTDLWDVYGNGPFNMAFDGVTTDFQNNRLVVGRGTGGATLSFVNGTFTSTADILMGVGSGAVGRMAFTNETISFVSGKTWDVGYSNTSAAEPALVVAKDSVINQSGQISVGGRSSAKGQFEAIDSAWTNSSAQSILVGGGTAGSGRVVLSNCTFKTVTATADRYSFVLGQKSGTTGRLDIAGGTFDSTTAGGCDTSKVRVGHASGATGILAIHDRTLTALPAFSSAEGSDSTIELIGCNYSSDAIAFGSKTNGMERLHIVGGSFSTSGNLIIGKNDVSDGGTGESEALFDGAAVNCDYFVAGRNANHPGSIVLRNGATVKASQVYIGYSAGAVGSYRDGTGASVVAKDFRAPHIGTAEAEIGGNVAVNRFFIGVTTAYTGTVTVVDGAFVDVTNSFNVGMTKVDGKATLELKGGVVLAPMLQRYSPGSASAGEARIYFNGGTLKARSDQASNWIASDFTVTAISDGGAVFDSNGHTVSSAASLTHDSRATAALKDGGIVKKGAGTVTLTGALSFNGDIRVEAGTLDLSSATYSMGESAGLSGSGTLMAPAGGLTCGGKVLLDASRGTLTVDGDLTLGGTATVEVENPETLDRSRSYTILSATSLSGTPTVSGLGNGWNVSNTGTALRLSYSSPTTIIMR
ncbi:MAG: autotransporter-associated beta strand repeat-containing protein [Kiritimatiellae bacterium]|nr:autotransporter-associated beta strand repeat-containing protein [Kiritimatiellia bacterium]